MCKKKRIRRMCHDSRSSHNTKGQAKDEATCWADFNNKPDTMPSKKRPNCSSQVGNLKREFNLLFYYNHVVVVVVEGVPRAVEGLVTSDLTGSDE
jgi:hypothetical protein